MKKKSLSKREEQFLLLLKKFGFLGSIRNTNKVLNRLSSYLNSFRDGYQSIFYLSKEGKLYVDCEKVRKKSGNIQHTIMRNDIWLYYGCPHDWRSEIKVSDQKTNVIVDAMFTKNLRYHFLEVDHLQSMTENRTKIKRYKNLCTNGSLAQTLNHFPRIVWLTTTNLREKQLLEACKDLPSVKGLYS
ncbi:replication-relaxation family protein [Psychrobacillus psychrotolerans]|uniref:replication-relaxation family protein n=1 Tax=Psychrobacillus psychrotolerans TaxID=126156 RepID=UPI003C75F822